jgi:26S proteasome regulatory subunit N5
MQVSPKAFAAGTKEQEAGEISLQGTAIETPEEGTPSMPELKVLYYNQMIRLHMESNNYIEIVRCLLAMYADKKSDSAESLSLLKRVVWYVLLFALSSSLRAWHADLLALHTQMVPCSEGSHPCGRRPLSFV